MPWRWELADGDVGSLSLIFWPCALAVVTKRLRIGQLGCMIEAISTNSFEIPMYIQIGQDSNGAFAWRS